MIDLLKLNKTIQYSLILSITAFLLVFSACEKDEDSVFTADFTYEYIDDNHVKFENKSDGDYYSMMWDFGNGVADTTTDKKETYTIYYPVAGDFNVSLKLLNYTGNSETTAQVVPITKTDLLVSFAMQTDPLIPNYVLLTNTSEGEFDSFRWLYRSYI